MWMTCCLHPNQQLQSKGPRDFYNAVAKSNLEEMHVLLKGTAGAAYVDPMTERTGMSLKMTVQNQLESFLFVFAG